MRNIQKNLIPIWNSSNKISELIKELPNLCNAFEYQIEKNLLPSIGEFTCEYSAQDLTKKIQIISKDFNKKTGFQMIFNDKVIGYTKELKFDKNSIFIIYIIFTYFLRKFHQKFFFYC